jgi:hypothetical protein
VEIKIRDENFVWLTVSTEAIRKTIDVPVLMEKIFQLLVDDDDVAEYIPDAIAALAFYGKDAP